MATPSRDRLLRTILGAQAAWPAWSPHPAASDLDSAYRLHKATGIAYSWVHRTLTELDAAGLLTFRPNQPILVNDVRGLYRWWAKHHKPPRRVSLHTGRPLDELAALQKAGIPTAATTYYAAPYYGGHLYHRRLDLYVDPRRIDQARALLLESHSLLGGTSLRLLADDTATIKEAVEVPARPLPLTIVPLPQAILDLRIEGAAAGEAADLILERAYPSPPLSTKTS